MKNKLILLILGIILWSCSESKWKNYEHQTPEVVVIGDYSGKTVKNIYRIKYEETLIIQFSDNTEFIIRPEKYYLDLDTNRILK